MVERTNEGLPPHGWSWGRGAENKMLDPKAGSKSKFAENRDNWVLSKCCLKEIMQILENPKRHSLERDQR